MKKLLLSFTGLLFCLFAFCQQDANQLHETAKTFMKQGDYSNATQVLLKALELEPTNLEIAKDLSIVYLVQKDNDKALEILTPFIDNNAADDQAYQVVANIYKAKNNGAEAEKIYKTGIAKYPQSGPLYSEYGEILWVKKDKTAITMWEKGIEMAPQYSGNYYNAANYYYLNNNNMWAILYGETFVNMESTTGRTTKIKNILLESYTRIFTDPASKNYKGRSPFEKAFLEEINKQSSLSSGGINAETITMIRTRFILDWTDIYAAKFPLKLFDTQKKLLEDGLFDAYNQWLFGAPQNLAAYQNWIAIHHAEYEEFSRFQSGRLYYPTKGQYYHK
jgi:tetratricopeptide (TPR) repeat protein